MEKRFLPGYRVADDGVPLSVLEGAGRIPGNLDHLKSKALGYRGVDPHVHAFLLSKSKPYAPGPGFDHMIFVAKDKGLIGGLEDLRPEALSRVLGMSSEVLSVYEKNAEPENPVVREFIAVNYHQDPVKEEIFERKLHAQTLKDLHVHVVAFRRDDVQELAPLERANISRDQYVELNEPLSFIVDRLVAIPALRERLSAGLQALRFTQGSQYSSLTFTPSADSLEDPYLSADLIQLHHNLATIYQELVELFVDTGTRDEAEMPVLHTPDRREQRIKDFFDTLKGSETPKPELLRLQKMFLGLSKKLKSGTEVQALPIEERQQTQIFLRSFAYTMAIIRDPLSHALTVTVSPRLLSAGNLLATLGYCKVTGEAPPAEWTSAKQRNEQNLREGLRT